MLLTVIFYFWNKNNLNYYVHNGCTGINVLILNRTTGMPKSVLRYDSLLLQYEILEKLVTWIQKK